MMGIAQSRRPAAYAAQLEKAVETVAAAEKRLAGRIRIDSVVPILRPLSQSLHGRMGP